MTRLALCLLTLPIMLAGQTPELTPEKRDFFENRIRPVLAQNCFACHTNSKMAGLRLDSREELLKGSASGPVVVPGDPDHSVMIAAIRSGKMPKEGRLMKQQIADLETWVKDGAYWPSEQSAKAFTITAGQRKFWSIQPLQNPPPPKVKDASWPRTDIDRFVLSRIENANMEPAPLADRRSLLRRVSYDLVGLPPTADEVKAFEADKSPKAYENVIDRLLASPRYGEAWARRWMDVVRFGEDDYRIAKDPDHMERYLQAHVYRDWVIKAMNEDMPYGDFVRAQIAGDLMDQKVRAKMIGGIGMNGLGVWSFNDSPPPIERADEWNDKVDTTTKAFLGLTVGCARCHDHKYDPIPTKDYYRLVSVFASTKYHPYPMVPKAVAETYDAQKKDLEVREKSQKKYLEDLSRLYAQTLLVQTEDYMVAAWRVKSQKKATVAGVADENKLDAEILERWIRFLNKPASNYTFLKPWQEMMNRGGSLDEAKSFAHKFFLKASDVNKLHDKVKEEEEIQIAKQKEKEETFDPLPNGIKRKLNPYQIELKGMDREESYLWTDMFEYDLAENPGNMNKLEKRPGLLKLTEWALEKRLSPQLSAYVARMKQDIEDLKKEMGPQYPYVDGLEDDKEPVNVKVFLRGNPYSFGEEAPRGFLSLLSPGEPVLFTKGSGRLQLAEEIVKQPLASRVIVNRLWRWHMGSGIVETPSNFGLIGDRPSNPELLDYLASKFVADGMSLKKLSKEILMSRTYQLSTRMIELNAAKDGDNRLYWRANRRRLEAEGIWDSLLFASGKLDLDKIGGPSEELSDKVTRRGLYGRVSRVFPNDFHTTFDLPTATLSAERRFATNVPLQRLFFLNSPFVEKQAEGLAQRVMDAGNDEARVRKTFFIALQREPSEVELKTSLELLRRPIPEPAQKSSPTAAAMAAKPEATSMTALPAASEPAAKPAIPSLKALCWALLSSNEFLFLN